MLNRCLILGITLLIAILYCTKKTTINEPYSTVGDNEHMRGQKETVEYLELKKYPSVVDKININAYDPFVNADDKTIYSNQKNTLKPLEGDYALDDVATDIMNESSKQNIDWKNVYVDDSSTVFTLMQNPSTSVDELYGRKGILNSEYKEDICTKYSGDFKTINKKCNELSATNCRIPDCCVLLNGRKCVVGNMHGPIFLTENGIKVDQTYYYYKKQCYGDCETSDAYAAACGNYSKYSTGISKECMIKMFNNYGCPNPKPDSLINDQMVKNYKKTTMEYVDNYIKKAVKFISSTRGTESRTLCNGS